MEQVFTQQELARYARHLAIPEFGEVAQERLKRAKVLVIGAGGLGSPLLLYLAAAGVGHIGIVEFDRIDDTNLQRQVLYTTKDVGQLKAEIAKERLLALNPYIDIEVYPFVLTSANAIALFEQYDVIADGTDNFPTRYLVNDACVLTGKPNVYASIFRFEGQLSVFNYKRKDGTFGPNYRDMFPEPPPPGMVPNCAEGGVLGVLPGIMGSFQANEVIKIVAQVGEPMDGRFLLFDAASMMIRTLKITKNPATSITTLIDYEAFCGVKPTAEIPSIDYQTLLDWQQEKDFQLIDVREDYEYQADNIGGELMPLSQLETFVHQISREKPVVVHCQKGQRSLKAIRLLKEKYNFDNLYNLQDGLVGRYK